MSKVERKTPRLKRIAVMLVLAALTGPHWAGDGLTFPAPVATAIQRESTTLRRPIAFEASAADPGSDPGFVARGVGYSVWLTPGGATIGLAGDLVRMTFDGAIDRPSMTPSRRVPGGTNYLIGRDQSRWQTGVPSYETVRYERLYPGIDLVFYGSDREIEYDFVLQPGADPNRIRLGLDGARDLKISATGDLIGSTRHGEIRFRKPVIYQTSIGGARTPIPGKYRVLDDATITFALGDYDRTRPLVIDPVVLYSTYLGGTSRDITRGPLTGGTQMVATDATGATYVVGTTDSVDFPTTPDSYLPTKNVLRPSVFVSKISPDGSSLMYSTYIGGTTADFGAGIRVDAAGHAYVIGYAGSLDFPAADLLLPFPRGGGHLFILKLDVSGSALDYSVLFGLAQEEAQGIALDGGGNAYVTGRTNGGIFNLISPGALQTVCRCGGSVSDAFVLKFNATATAMVYGSYLGGGDKDDGTAIAVNAAGEAFVTGRTSAGDFPTVNAVQDAHAGGLKDVFVARVNANGSALLFSTYLGGTGTDSLNTRSGIAVDSNGNAYVTGDTQSTDFPTTPGAFQPTVPSAAPSPLNAFLTKFAPDGSIVYSTYLGGDGGTVGTSVAVDTTGRAYVVGGTDAHDFPVVDATQPALTCGAFCPYDAFVSVFDPAGSSLVFSTYIGGPLSFDVASGVAIGADGVIHLVGDGSVGFPTTADAIQPSHAGGEEAFVVRIRLDTPDTTAPVVTTSGDQTVDATSPQGAVVTFLATATDDVDGILSPTCVPVSGSTFTFGTTQVTCSATDASGNTGEATLNVTVLTAIQMLDRLIATASNLGFQQGVSLLQNARWQAAGNPGAACNQIEAFMRQVQASKRLPSADKESLVLAAGAVRLALGCN